MGHQKRKRVIYVVACFFSSFVILASTTSSVNALSEYWRTVFKENKGMFWNPEEDGATECPPGTEPTPSDEIIIGDDVASTIIGFLMKNGYEHDAAVAITANLKVESGLNPRKLQGGTVVDEDYIPTPNGVGFGLAQWTNSRTQKLIDYSNEHGLKPTSLKAQLGYLLTELVVDGHAKASALNGKSLEEATFIVRRYFERPGGMIYDTHDGHYYNDYVPNSLGDLDPAKTPAAWHEHQKAMTAANSLIGVTPGDGNIGVGGGTGCVSKEIDLTGLIFYSQCDPKWRNLKYSTGGIHDGNSTTTICGSGCGPTSFAVIAANLLKNASITPAETTDLAGRGGMYVPGVGSSHSITSFLAGKYGLTAQQISKSISIINQYLDNGYMIHTSGSGSKPYTAGGHYIAIVKKMPNGNWLVGDSSKNGPSAEYTPETVMSGMNAGNVWAVKR